MKKAQIEQSLREELTKIRYIESRINQIDQQGELRDYEIVIKSAPAQRLIAVRESSATLAACRTMAQEIGRFLPARIGRQELGHLAMIFYSDLWDSERLDVAIGFLLNGEVDTDLALPSGQMAHVQELPAVEMMATTMHVGIPEASHRSYAALGQWAEANDYHFVSPSREILIQLPHPGAEDDIVAEVQIPIQRAAAPD